MEMYEDIKATSNTKITVISTSWVCPKCGRLHMDRYLKLPVQDQCNLCSKKVNIYECE